MRKSIPIVVLMICAVNLVACSGATAAPTPKAQATVPAIRASSKVVAEGKVLPARSASLGLELSGTAVQVPVSAGDRVKAGQVLVQLDSKQLELALAQADADVASAQSKVTQLKRGPLPEELAAAQQAVKSAQADYDNLLKPSENEMNGYRADIEKSKAAVDRAQAAYDRIGGNSNPFASMTMERQNLQTAWNDYQKALSQYNVRVSPPDNQVQQAVTKVQNAKNQLAQLTPKAEDIAAAEAGVKSAQAARDLAADKLTRAKLTAPFDGTIVSVDIKPGEQAVAGTPVMRLGDLTNMQVETTDLTEINVVNVKEGDAAAITLDAIPGLELTGKVATIKGFGENRQGDIVYTLVIKLDKQDERLRWNMTAKVSIVKQ